MKQESKINSRAVYVVDGCRTPFLKSKGIGPFTASDLAVQAGKTLLNRQPFQASDIDEVILGCVMPSADEANIARIIALRLGCGDDVPAYTVMRNCASGMQALDSAYQQIATGRSDLILAGGTEAMSHAPLLFNQKMTAWFLKWMSAKQLKQRFGLVFELRPSWFAPVIALLRGLTDPVVGLNMGQTAEELAFRFQISREMMDELAMRSHLYLEKAYESGWMDEVVPIIDSQGQLYEKDTGLRPDTTLEKLAKLPPFFDKKYGMVTAGNSSQITDGACLLLLASEHIVKEYNLPILGRIVDCSWAALDPRQMGLGPVYAASTLLQKFDLNINDIDCWEINEAFAAQVLACTAAMANTEFCKTELGLKQALGTLDTTRLNVDGGAIAAGHPVGASGARIVLHVLKYLQRTQGKRGLASICIGGGQGGAMMLERVEGVNHD